MTTLDLQKKEWTKPVLESLKIYKTYGGDRSGSIAEGTALYTHS